MNFAFYISNHGFGHAARNIPLIEKIWRDDKKHRIFIKTDSVRVEMIKRNLTYCDERIIYCGSYKECGIIFRDDCLEVDIGELYHEVKKEIQAWDSLIAREIEILKREKIDIVISDITPWVLKACRILHIPSVLISNFTWFDHYKLYLPEELSSPYKECYKLAEQVVFYDLHVRQMQQYCNSVTEVSLVARRGNSIVAEQIRRQYKTPIIFVSIGKSVSIVDSIEVGNIPYTFIATQGVNLTGNNVVFLPETVVNTMDYISASDYVISKCGWSTVAEILLNNKKCALLSYSDSLEEKAILEKVIKGNNGLSISFADFKYHLDEVIRKLSQLQNPSDIYWDDRDKIVEIIYSGVKNDSFVS